MLGHAKMADHEWYYAKDDQQQGPVGRNALVHLLTKGRLSADTLVWHEGLDDWAPANEVAELLGGQSVPPPPVQPTGSATTAAAQTPPTQAPVVSAPGTWQKYLGARRRGGGVPLDPLQYVRLIGQPLILCGLCMVLLARGCDSIGNRYVARLEAKSQLAVTTFQDETQRQEQEIEVERRAVREDEVLDEADRTRELRILSGKLEELTETRQAEQRELQQGAWARAAAAARNAQGTNTLWAFWRETVFVLGTVLFAVGLVAVGFSRTGPERWVCLVMLAIIVFSLYVGGIAWVGSMAGLVR